MQLYQSHRSWVFMILSYFIIVYEYHVSTIHILMKPYEPFRQWFDLPPKKHRPTPKTISSKWIGKTWYTWLGQRLEHGRNPRASCLPVPFMSTWQSSGLWPCTAFGRWRRKSSEGWSCHRQNCKLIACVVLQNLLKLAWVLLFQPLRHVESWSFWSVF